MKKLVLFFVAAVFAATFVSCGSRGASNTDNESTSPVEEVVTEEVVVEEVAPVVDSVANVVAPEEKAK